MMTPLLAFALTALPCDDPAANNLRPEAGEEACALLSRAQPTSTIAPGSLEQIYARPRFVNAHKRNGSTLKLWLQQLEAWLESLFSTRGAETYSTVTRFLVLIVAVLGAAWLGLRVAARRRSAKVAPRQAVSNAALPLEDPSVHLQRARALVASAPREAIREAVYSLLSELERARLARPDRVKTNRELVGELPARGAAEALVVAVSTALTWYDAVFYSLAEVAEADARGFIDQVAAVGSTVHGGRAS